MQIAIANRLRTVLIGVMALLIVSGAVIAQDPPVDSAADYPTVAALREAVLPVRDRLDLAQRFAGLTTIPPRPTEAPKWAIGDVQQFVISDTSAIRTVTINASLRAAGDHALIWVEDSYERINQRLLDILLREFDKRIYPQSRALWGEEDMPGIDGDPRAYIVFTGQAGAGTAGYYASDNTYPRAAVPTSSEHDMFVMSAPYALTPGVDALELSRILAHEFQHMIRANVQRNEETWVNEGFSQLSEILIYPQVAQLPFALFNDPGNQLNAWSSDPFGRAADYASSFLFTTYFYDRFGADALTQWSEDGAARGLDSLAAVLTALDAPPIDEVIADWVMANLILNPTIADGRYGYQSLPRSQFPEPLVARERLAIGETAVTTRGTTNQYGTAYVELIDATPGDTLTLTLESPSEVALIDADAGRTGRVWYSNRGDMSNPRLTRRFDLSGVEAATLTYRAWYDLEELWDYAYVSASTDDGATWTLLTTDRMTDDNPFGTAYGAGYTGISGGWVEESIDLTAFAGGEVLLRFEMITDDAINNPGIAIDDVRIPAIDYSADFEADDGGWIAEGWLLTDNRLPQAAWLQTALWYDRDTTDVLRERADGGGTWTLTIPAGIERVILALTPHAPVTTVPMPYTLTITRGG